MGRHTGEIPRIEVPERRPTPPLYARVLGLKHLRPGRFACFLFFEGAAVLAALLALAGLVTWWGMVALPVAVAVMVLLNDRVAGRFPRVPRRPPRPARPGPARPPSRPRPNDALGREAVATGTLAAAGARASGDAPKNAGLAAELPPPHAVPENDGSADAALSSVASDRADSSRGASSHGDSSHGDVADPIASPTGAVPKPTLTARRPAAARSRGGKANGTRRAGEAPGQPESAPSAVADYAAGTDSATGADPAAAGEPGAADRNRQASPPAARGVDAPSDAEEWVPRHARAATGAGAMSPARAGRGTSTEPSERARHGSATSERGRRGPSARISERAGRGASVPPTGGSSRDGTE